MASNVHITNQTVQSMSRTKLLDWVNVTLRSDFRKVDELCTGAAYCQLMDLLFPGSVPLKRIKYCTNVQYDFCTNLRLLQDALNKVKVGKSVPIQRLANGRLQDNLEFLQWFKKFFDTNYDGKEYDALAIRESAPLCYGTPPRLPSTGCRSTTAEVRRVGSTLELLPKERRKRLWR